MSNGAYCCPSLKDWVDHGNTMYQYCGTATEWSLVLLYGDEGEAETTWVYYCPFCGTKLYEGESK